MSCCVSCLYCGKLALSLFSCTRWHVASRPTTFKKWRG